MNQIDTAFPLPKTEELATALRDDKDNLFGDMLKAMKIADQLPERNEAYINYLLDMIRRIVQRQSTKESEEELKKRHGGRINVFSVCGSSYHEWLNEYRDQDPPLGPYMSGIPHLSQALLSLTAEQKLQHYHTHYFQVLAGLVDTIQRIITKSTEKKEVFLACRHALDQRFQIAIQLARAAIDINALSIVPTIFQAAEKDTITKNIKSLILKWSDPFIVHFRTFLHTIVCRGIPTSYASVAYRDREDINLNRDVLEAMERPRIISHEYTSAVAHLSSWRLNMLAKSREISSSVTEPIVALWLEDDNTVKSIIQHSSASSALKRRTHAAWNRVKSNIHEMAKKFPKTLEAAINAAYRDVTTEEDIGCMIATMNEQAWHDAESQRRGPKVYSRQRQSLINSLTHIDAKGKTFVDRYEAAAIEKMNNRVRLDSRRFLTDVESTLDEFIRITEQFFETDVYNTPQHASARQILRNWLPDFQDVLLECQRKFPGQKYQEDVQFISSVKRVGSELSSPVKKIKLEDQEEE
ncbi:hypothetical protein N0V90_013062 [Kalmusia sp. IMI 367209]|nr:hypothetical protein N0V90_013062 [Kalmusia sp. IMI 367209]